MNNFPMVPGVSIGDRDLSPPIRERRGIGVTPVIVSEIQVCRPEAPEV